MEKISLNNYQAYMLDLIEGNLNETSRNALFAFLELHPELKSELEDFENLNFKELSANQDYPEKDTLRKNATPDDLLIGYVENTLSPNERTNLERQLETSAILREQLRIFRLTLSVPDPEVTFEKKDELKKQELNEEQLIAYIENLLSAEERKVIEERLSQSVALKNDLKLFKQTIFTSDLSIDYPDKEELKRSAKIIAFPQWNYKRLAVAASLLFLIGLAVFFAPSSADKARAFIYAGEIKTLKFIFGPVLSEGEKRQLATNNSEKNIPNPLNNGIAFKRDSLRKRETPLIVFSPGNDSLPVKNTIPEENVPGRSNILVINRSSVDDLSEDTLNEERLNTKQYIAQRIQEAAWGEEANKKPVRKKLSAFDVVAAFAKKLKHLGNNKTDAKIEYNEDTETEEYTLTLGKLSVTRSKPNRE
ncbi:MAG: hypothetical protein ACJ76F_04955 [Bacteroidia bacterium]